MKGHTAIGLANNQPSSSENWTLQCRMLLPLFTYSTFPSLLNMFGHNILQKGLLSNARFNTISARNSNSRTFSTLSANKARGGLPRFYSEVLPIRKDSVVRVEGDEFWHMIKVLRIGVEDRVELFNGRGGIVEGLVLRVDRTSAEIIALGEPQMLTPKGPQWHVVSAFGTLKGGRADWLIEKCTELGASSIAPLLTERSPSINESRLDRWQRVMLSASKQCQRLHEMALKPPIGIDSLLPQVAQSRLSFLAMADATPLVDALSMTDKNASGLLLVGPEGDFSAKEVKALLDVGAIPIGLGPRRLRVETATVALLATAMLWSDVQQAKS